MDKIKVGVLGVGHLGRLHASLYKEISTAEVIGIYDTNREKAEKLAEELNLQLFNNSKDLLKSVDAVNIVTPTPNHYESAIKALEYDCHLFIEKPITDNEQNAEDLIRRANESNKILQIGHIERFNPAILALEELINWFNSIETINENDNHLH